MLCSFIRATGRRLREPVLMTPEGTDAVVVLRYDVDQDRVVLVADP
ncbi:hypothetical protein [Saccharothrix saharensis]|nr:hypothetical protein [Saccharothrix saharensis]